MKFSFLKTVIFSSIITISSAYIGTILENCNSNPPFGDPIICQEPLVCDSYYMKCLAPIGQTCRTLIECVRNSYDCYDSICQTYDQLRDVDCKLNSTKCTKPYVCDTIHHNTCRLPAHSNCTGYGLCEGYYACHDGICDRPRLLDICDRSFAPSSPKCVDGLECNWMWWVCLVPLGGKCNNDIECGGTNYRVCKNGTCQNPGLNQICSNGNTFIQTTCSNTHGICDSVKGVCIEDPAYIFDVSYEAHLLNVGNDIVAYSAIISMPIGVIGNGLVLWGYTSNEMIKHSVSFWYCASAVIHTIYIINQSGSSLVLWFHKNLDMTHFCIFYQVLTPLFKTISSFFSIMTSVDRLRFVVYSQRFKFMEARWFQFITALLITAIFSGAYVPSMYILVWVDTYCGVANVPVNNIYGIINLIFYAFLPSAIVIICSVSLIMAVTKSKKKFRKSNSGKKENQLIRNVLAVQIIFTVTTLLCGCLRLAYTIIMTYYGSLFNHVNGLISVTLAVARSFEMFNYCGGVFIHYFTNKIFAKKIRTIMRQCNKSS